MSPDVLFESLGHAAAAVPFAGGPYLVAALLVMAAYAPGRSLAGEMAPFSPLERWAFSTGLGLVALGTLFFALGLAGWFTLPAVAAALALVQAPRLTVWVRAWRREGRFRWPVPGGATLAAGAGAVALTLFVGTLALYPPLGFDATLYHLPTAQALAEGHRLPFLADSRVPVFPQLAEVLFGAALLFGDDRAARLLELAMTALAAVALFGWVRRRASAAAGLWAAALWAGSPYVVLFGSDAYVEGTLTLFAVLAIQALDGWREDRAVRWRWLAGALVGAAAATKYLGLFFVAAVPVGFLLAARSRRGVGAAATALLAAVLVAGPWYGRITLLTGNPVFPFFPEVFGATDWAPFVGLSPPGDAAAGGPVAALGSGLRRLALGSGGDWRTWTGPPPFAPFLWVLAPVVLLLARGRRRPARASSPSGAPATGRSASSTGVSAATTPSSTSGARACGTSPAGATWGTGAVRRASETSSTPRREARKPWRPGCEPWTPASCWW